MTWIVKYKWEIISVVIIILVIYFMGKKAGQNTPPVAIALPPDTIPPGGSTTFNPGPYTDAVYNDIYGGIFTARDITAYNNALDLSDSQLAAVYNDWNARYWQKDHETLIDALNGEHWSFTSTDFRTLKNQLVDRLTKLVNQGTLK